jgi:hypothetical protein
MRKTHFAVAFVLLCSCVSTAATQVRPADVDTYTVTGRALTASGDDGAAASDAASKFCSKRGKRMLPTDREQDAQDSGLNETTLWFRCLAPGESDDSEQEIPASPESPE